MDGGRIERVESDNGETEKLFRLVSGVYDKGMVRYGENRAEVEARVLVAALKFGERRGQIRFKWFEGEKIAVEKPTVTVSEDESGKYVEAMIDRRIFGKIAGGVELWVPGGQLPTVDDVIPYIIGGLRSARALGAVSVEGWEWVKEMVDKIYTGYRKI